MKLHILQLFSLFQDVDKKIDGVDGVDAQEKWGNEGQSKKKLIDIEHVLF